MQACFNDDLFGNGADLGFGFNEVFSALYSICFAK